MECQQISASQLQQFKINFYERNKTDRGYSFSHIKMYIFCFPKLASTYKLH